MSLHLECIFDQLHEHVGLHFTYPVVGNVPSFAEYQTETILNCVQMSISPPQRRSSPAMLYPRLYLFAWLQTSAFVIKDAL